MKDSTKKHSGFAKSFAGMKGGTFHCDMCGKLTRDTGENGSCNLCPECYKDCIEENIRSDFGEEKLEEWRKTGKL
jgi:hypothetical protein